MHADLFFPGYLSYLYYVHLCTNVHLCIQYLYMSTERVVTEVITQMVAVTRFFHFTVDSDVATQQPDLCPQVNRIFRHQAKMTMANRTYTPDITSVMLVCQKQATNNNRIVSKFLVLAVVLLQVLEYYHYSSTGSFNYSITRNLPFSVITSTSGHRLRPFSVLVKLLLAAFLQRNEYIKNSFSLLLF